MIRRRVIALATGIVLITACMVTIAVWGDYPQTGFVQIMLWGGILVSSAVAGYTAGWIYAQTKDEASASRVVTSMVIGLVCGGIAALILYGLAAVVVLALIANAHLTGLADGRTPFHLTFQTALVNSWPFYRGGGKSSLDSSRAPARRLAASPRVSR